LTWTRFLLLLTLSVPAGPAGALTPLPDVEAAAAAEGVQPHLISLTAVGDLMMHGSQVRAALQPDGRYLVEGYFDAVAGRLSAADLTYGNLETTLAGEDMAYAGYPAFNSPRTLATDLRSAGFDVLQTANNHSMDRREKGLIRTLQALDAEGLRHVGTRADPDGDPTLWVELAGLKVALLAYTFSVNGIPLPPGREQIVSDLDPERMEAEIGEALAGGADLVIVGCHWGAEYQSTPRPEVVELGTRLVEAGADIVLGGHPHWVQPYEVVTASDGREGFVAWSLGNFVSNMRKRNEDVGIILELTLALAPDGGLALADVGYAPTWVDATDASGRTHHTVFEILAELPSCGHHPRLDAADCARMRQALEDTRELLGEGDLLEPPAAPAFTDPTGGEGRVAP
jgi:poly-gamma-glutamate capsule biosynthesis protein CapA/YwtB (metallophosphatase superfamily)